MRHPRSGIASRNRQSHSGGIGCQCLTNNFQSNRNGLGHLMGAFSILHIQCKLPKFVVMLSGTEENYLKALLRITGEHGSGGEAGTNQLAGKLNGRPATATDMLKKLREKQLVNYEKYGKIS